MNRETYENLVRDTRRAIPAAEFASETAWRAQRPSVRDTRTEWTVTQLPGQKAPGQRSTKYHNKPGYRTRGATWRQCQVRNPIK